MNTKLLELVNLLLKTDKKVYLVLCKALNMGLRQFFCKKNWQAIQTASGSTKFYKKLFQTEFNFCICFIRNTLTTTKSKFEGKMNSDLFRKSTSTQKFTIFILIIS